MKKIVVFGFGKAFFSREDFFKSNANYIELVAFIDNKKELQGSEYSGIPILPPTELKKLEFDAVVILSKKFFFEMYYELINLDIDKKIIWDFSQLAQMTLKGKRLSYGPLVDLHKYDKRILIITTDMRLSGGILVSLYAAIALKKSGYEVVLSGPSITEDMLELCLSYDLSITISPTLPYIYSEDIEWINQFDMVIISVFQMMKTAFEISKIKPVVWWIHEPKSKWTNFYYQDTQNSFSDIDNAEWMTRLNIVGVSELAKDAFNHFYPSVMERTMPFCIPDYINITPPSNLRKSKIVFSVLAGFAELKGQKILIDALHKLNNQDRYVIEVWFIGPNGENMRELINKCDDLDGLKFLGLLTHDEVIDALNYVDVVVCPSLIESMSMSIVEGMMFGKIVIASTMCGVSKYIEDGKNGFVFENGNADELANRISWIINNRKKWNTLQTEARKTFENVFSLKNFPKMLEEELRVAKDKFKEAQI